jgi:hypothetical protein
LAERAIAIDEQPLALRKKYCELMTKVLPTTLVTRFLQLENQIDLTDRLEFADYRGSPSKTIIA